MHQKNALLTSAAVSFTLNGKYKLTSILVVPAADYKINKKSLIFQRLFLLLRQFFYCAISVLASPWNLAKHFDIAQSCVWKTLVFSGRVRSVHGPNAI